MPIHAALPEKGADDDGGLVSTEIVYMIQVHGGGGALFWLS